MQIISVIRKSASTVVISLHFLTKVSQSPRSHHRYQVKNFGDLTYPIYMPLILVNRFLYEQIMMMEKVTWFPVHLMKFDENLNPTLKNYHLQIISLN